MLILVHFIQFWHFLVLMSIYQKVSATQGVGWDAPKQAWWSVAWSIVESAVLHVVAFLLEHMATNLNADVTETSSTPKENPSALDSNTQCLNTFFADFKMFVSSFTFHKVLAYFIHAEKCVINKRYPIGYLCRCNILRLLSTILFRIFL